VGGKPFIISKLDSNHPNMNLDLYFRAEQEVEFVVEGNGEVHLTGYYDPSEPTEESQDLSEAESEEI
jgi:hypothetical protein